MKATALAVRMDSWEGKAVGSGQAEGPGQEGKGTVAEHERTNNGK